MQMLLVSYHSPNYMYVQKVYLGIRDKKDWSKWSFSPDFDNVEACFNQYKSWIAEHPGAVISFMTRSVWVPDPKPAKQAVLGV